jgi:hypothetical protein
MGFVASAGSLSSPGIPGFLKVALVLNSSMGQNLAMKTKKLNDEIKAQVLEQGW